MNDFKPLTQIQKRDGDIFFAIMKLLHEHGDEMKASEIYDELPQKFKFTEHEKAPKNTWPVLWHSIMHMIGIEYKYAGYLDYHNGVWQLQQKGIDAVKDGPSDFYRRDAIELYRAKPPKNSPIIKPDSNPIAIEELAPLQSIKEMAAEGIKNAINSLNPMVFQDFVASIFRAMGYCIGYISPKGPDGGVDIILYQDPLGVKRPHVRVQVKRYTASKVSNDVVLSLVGCLRHSDDIGIIVTCGDFTSEARREARNSHMAVKLIDGKELIDLWIQYYDKLSESEKAMLPIEPVYFIKQNEE